MDTTMLAHAYDVGTFLDAVLAGDLELPPDEGEGPPATGDYGGLDDYYIVNGLTSGYESSPLQPGPQAGVLADQPDALEPPPIVTSTAARETRAIWVSRFDLPRYPSPQTMQTIVDKAAYANLNTILFQVRGQADALYHSSVEPWSAYLTGTLGQHPGCDPLAEMILRAHAQGIKVHAWINAYPAWLGTTPPPDLPSPRPMYHEFNALYGDWWVHWLQGTPPTPTQLNDNYICGSPAHPGVADRIIAVCQDILTRYPVDGLHFDYIRYLDRPYSYDPVSLIAYANAVASNPGLTYADWQRARITALLSRVGDEALPLRPRARLTTTAWPTYKDRWGWYNGYDGYSARYQDSQVWASSGVVSAILPMMYGSTITPSRERYDILTRDFVQGSGSGAVIPGITGEYTSFQEIAWRIDTARAAGARGQALFSYRLIDQNNYWQALRSGPYRDVAIPDWP